MTSNITFINKNTTSTLKLPTALDVPINNEILSQAVITTRGNRHRGTAHAKTRSEVSGTGKKPWKQKGTGRARHGSMRSPIWIGGGITFGPRSANNFTRKL